MLVMYRYECRPNYPVVSCAFVLFAIDQTTESNALEIGRKLAEWYGCSYAGEEERAVRIANISYLNHIKSTVDEAAIIDYITGEY